jgi:hypothetical protein
LGGLLLVGIVAAIVLILVLRKRRESEAIDESGSDDVHDMVEAASTFSMDDQYLSQEAPSDVVVALAKTVPDES